MALWLVDAEGESHRVLYPYAPYFYLSGSTSDLRKAGALVSSWGAPVSLKLTPKKEFYSDAPMKVLQVKVLNPLRYAQLVNRVIRLKYVEPFTCDLSPVHLFFYDTGLFPLALIEVDIEGDGPAFRGMAAVGANDYSPLLLDSPWKIDYSLPPFRVMELRIENGRINPSHTGGGALSVVVGGEEQLLEPEHIVTGLNSLIQRHDPHVILSHWGDSYVMPRLHHLAFKEGRALLLDREGGIHKGRRGWTYFSYGRVVYRAHPFYLYGRWHLDVKNSFILAECGMEGLLELARLSKIPVQQVSRQSTGTCITSMQLEVAHRGGYLIPWRKRMPENYKTAEELLITDKGGLTYKPVPGLYEQVGELDFSSMYPTIMARYNLSPETIDCACCPDAPRVPEAGYRICRKRRGLVPETLTPILKKRRSYKAAVKAAADAVGANDYSPLQYDRRQTALKWMLVTCFGYLGYKNARFGRIEAHESTTALGREKLLLAKEIAERSGYRMLHALTDSLWLQKPGAALHDYERLAEEISRCAGIPIGVEGIYKWISFLPSKMNPAEPVPGRYFGLFQDGAMRVRGLEVRRSDAPIIVKRAQSEMLKLLMNASSVQEYQQTIPQILKVLEEYWAMLDEGNVPPEELAITLTVSQDPTAYRKASLTAIAAQELLGRGVPIHPGEKVQVVVTSGNPRLPSDRAKPLASWDGTHSMNKEKYKEYLLKAAEPLLIHFGWDHKKLRSFVEQSPMPLLPPAPIIRCVS